MSLLSPRFFRPKSRSRSATDARARRPDARVPPLLVSVRNALEARAAVVGGCDLLDVKEPVRGPLGMADRPVMAAIAELAAGCRGTATPLPAARRSANCATGNRNPAPQRSRCPPGISYLKLGAAGIASAERWVDSWRLVQSRLETPAGADVQWVAVAYADWRRAQSLEPSQMLAAARVVNCSVLLLDTFDKQAGNLLEVTDCSTLRRLVDAARQAGLRIAFAGGLHRSQVAELLDLGPDLVGVRSSGVRRRPPHQPDFRGRSSRVQTRIARDLRRGPRAVDGVSTDIRAGSARRRSGRAGGLAQEGRLRRRVGAERQVTAPIAVQQLLALRIRFSSAASASCIEIFANWRRSSGDSESLSGVPSATTP